MQGLIDATHNYRLHSSLPYFARMGRTEAEGAPVDLDALIARMDACGIERTGIVANVSAENLRRGGSGRVLDDNDADLVAEAIARHPDRLFGWVGINPLGLMDTLRYIEHAVVDLGYKAVHVFPHWFVVPVNDRIYYPIYAKCVELGVPIAMQLGIPGSPSGAKTVALPQHVDDVLFDFPELSFGCLHLGNPYESAWIALARNYVNFFLVADHPVPAWSPEMIEHLRSPSQYLDLSTRVVWGTNGPVVDPATALHQIGELRLPDHVVERITSDNARRLLHL